MNKLMCMFVGLMMGGAPWLLAADDEGSQLTDKGPSKMREKVTESRAEKYKDSGGVSKDGRKYVYTDEKDINAATKGIPKLGSKRNGKEKEVNIGTTTINKGERVNRVDVVVKTDKKIDVKTDGKPTEVNIGQVKVEDGAAKYHKVETNIIVDAEKGIKVH